MSRRDQVTGRLERFGDEWFLTSFEMHLVAARHEGRRGFITTRHFRRRIDAIAFAARKGIRLTETP